MSAQGRRSIGLDSYYSSRTGPVRQAMPRRQDKNAGNRYAASDLFRIRFSPNSIGLYVLALGATLADDGLASSCRWNKNGSGSPAMASRYLPRYTLGRRFSYELYQSRLVPLEPRLSRESMRSFTVSVFASCLCFLADASAVAADSLAVTENLAASKYKDWKYGSNPDKMQVDCVQFLLAIVEESVGVSLAPQVRSRIFIAELSEEEKKHRILDALVIDGNERTKGVQSALAEASLGTAVSAEDAASGDLIQYWMKKSDGTWFGHAGVIESVDRSGPAPKARIYGAHASPAPGKIGSSTFELRLIDGSDDRRIYLVRLK